MTPGHVWVPEIWTAVSLLQRVAVITLQSLLAKTPSTNGHFRNHLQRRTSSTFLSLFQKQVSSSNTQENPILHRNSELGRESLRSLTEEGDGHLSSGTTGQLWSSLCGSGPSYGNHNSPFLIRFVTIKWVNTAQSAWDRATQRKLSKYLCFHGASVFF